MSFLISEIRTEIFTSEKQNPFFFLLEFILCYLEKKIKKKLILCFSSLPVHQ